MLSRLFASVLIAGAGLLACSSDEGSSLSRRSVDDPDGGSTQATDGGSTQATDGGTATPSDGGGPSTGSDKPSCVYPGQAHKTGLSSLQQAGGLAFSVYAPTTYDPKVGHAVVVLLHGQDSNGVPELNALWKSIADSQSLVVVAPRGSRPATNGDANAGNYATADLDKILQIMTTVDDCYNVLVKKHILWGFSEGGFYGYLLGIGAADRFSGLAMGGANTSFARQSGYEPKDATWKIPVSHVHGAQDQNPIAQTYQDRTDFQAAGHVFTLHEHAGGHTISAAQVLEQYTDLASSLSP